MDMFVPVSPSGTGNTFSSLIHSFFASRLFAPARNIFASSDASIFSVPTYPTITTESWNGNEFIKQRNIVEDFYWDSEKGLMMDVGEGFEVELDELPEIEQLNVCQVIIDAAQANGIEL